jgi:signal peptidase II
MMEHAQRRHDNGHAVPSAPEEGVGSYALLIGLALLIVLVDQATKWLVETRLKDGKVIELLGGLVRLDYTLNTGAAFGILRTRGLLFALVAVVVSVGIVVYYRAVASSPAAIRVGLALVLGGAVGNLIDRVRLGYVVDFVDLRWWPVFNVADSAIVIGVCLLIGYALFSAGPHGSR